MHADASRARFGRLAWKTAGHFKKHRLSMMDQWWAPFWEAFWGPSMRRPCPTLHHPRPRSMRLSQGPCNIPRNRYQVCGDDVSVHTLAFTEGGLLFVCHWCIICNPVILPDAILPWITPSCRKMLLMHVEYVRRVRCKRKCFLLLNLEYWLICDQLNKKISDWISHWSK